MQNSKIANLDRRSSHCCDICHRCRCWSRCSLRVFDLSSIVDTSNRGFKPKAQSFPYQTLASGKAVAAAEMASVWKHERTQTRARTVPSPDNESSGDERMRREIQVELEAKSKEERKRKTKGWCAVNAVVCTWSSSSPSLPFSVDLFFSLFFWLRFSEHCRSAFCFLLRCICNTFGAFFSPRPSSLATFADFASICCTSRFQLVRAGKNRFYRSSEDHKPRLCHKGVGTKLAT